MVSAPSLLGVIHLCDWRLLRNFQLSEIYRFLLLFPVSHSIVFTGVYESWFIDPEIPSEGEILSLRALSHASC